MLNINKPIFISDQFNSGDWELCGQFFSISCVRNSFAYDIVLDYSDGESTLLKKSITEDEDVAKNLCEIYYNKVIEQLQGAKAGLED